MYKVYVGEELKKTCDSLEEAHAEASRLSAIGEKNVVVVVPSDD